MGGYIFGHNDKVAIIASDVDLKTRSAVEAVTYLSNSTPTGSSRPIVGDNGLERLLTLFTE